MSDIGDDIDSVDDPGPQDSDPSPADPGPNGPAGKDSILGPQDASNLAGFDKLPSDIFRTDGGSGYGFPELTDPSNASPFNADADLTNKKELAEGAFKLLTGENLPLVVYIISLRKNLQRKKLPLDLVSD